MIPVGKVEGPNYLAFLLGYKLGSLQSTYLGLHWQDINQKQSGMVWRKDWGRDWKFGKIKTSQKVEDSLWFRVHCQVCQTILCDYFKCQKSMEARLGKIRCDFLLGGVLLSKCHLVMGNMLQVEEGRWSRGKEVNIKEPSTSLQMELVLCHGRRVFLETNYCSKIWCRGR